MSTEEELIKHLDIMNDVFKKIRGNSLPMGGIQIIFTGDFLQLSPINDELAFKSNAWKDLNLHTIYLREMYRFTDKKYSDMLSRIRVGDHTSDDIKDIYQRFFAYKKLEESEVPSDKLIIKPSFLFGKKVDVEEKNMEELSLLSSPLEKLQAIDYSDNKYDLEFMDNIAPRILLMKEGAQVMVNVNLSMEESIINGTRGIVKSISSDIIDVELLNGSTVEIMRHEFIYEKPNTNINIKQKFLVKLKYIYNFLLIHAADGEADKGKLLF
jgi:ATP-dependent DNA helicase PIF1